MGRTSFYLLTAAAGGQSWWRLQPWSRDVDKQFVKFWLLEKFKLVLMSTAHMESCVYCAVLTGSSTSEWSSATVWSGPVRSRDSRVLRIRRPYSPNFTPITALLPYRLRYASHCCCWRDWPNEPISPPLATISFRLFLGISLLTNRSWPSWRQANGMFMLAYLHIVYWVIHIVWCCSFLTVLYIPFKYQYFHCHHYKCTHVFVLIWHLGCQSLLNSRLVLKSAYRYWMSLFSCLSFQAADGITEYIVQEFFCEIPGGYYGR